MNLNISYNPTFAHITEIKRWLEKEDNLSNDGFYCQWDVITASFEKKRMIVITENDNAIGFLTYSKYDFVVDIIIAEIMPDKRNQGIGKKLLTNCFSYFIERGALVVELFCSPVTSEKIWKRMGFINFPDGIIRDSNIYLYQILVPTLDFSEDDNSKELIELWNEPDHMVCNSAPKWRWGIQRCESSNTLIKPIIHPASYEWPVCSRKGKLTNEKTIMKNFNKGRNEHGHFLIINELARFDL